MSDGDSHDTQTPRDILARARELAAAGDNDGALGLLLDHQNDMEDFPPAYDALIGRQLLRKGNAKAALGYMNSARVAYGENMPVEQRRDLAIALLKNGRIEAAGREFSFIVKAGAEVNNPLYWAALDAYENRAGADLDGPAATPYRVLAEAAVLIDKKDFAAARALLTAALAQNAQTWTSVPAAYHARLRQLSLWFGETAAEIANLPEQGELEAAGEQPLAPPRDIMARAKILAAEANEAGALALLLACNQGDVPPAYKAMMGHYMLRSGNAAAAVEHFTGARDAYGETMPVEQRREFAAALFQSGRIEAAGQQFEHVAQAGATVAKPAYRAAMQAYAHRAGEDLDGPVVTPYRVLAQAEALAEKHDLAGAYRLLTASLAEHGDRWGSLPATFQATLGRVAFRSGDRETAITHLVQARDAAGDDVPASIRQPLGTALFEIGRFAEAGQELDLALRAGATISRADLLIAINAYRKKQGSGDLLDATFARNLTLVDTERKLVCVAVPQNASTFMRASVILNSRYREAYLASGDSIHKFCGGISAAMPIAETLADADSFKFVLLREPLARTLSAYLNYFVLPKEKDAFVTLQLERTIAAAQSTLGIPVDTGRSITFEEFVRHLAQCEDVECDVHWMPQVNMTGADLGRYDHVGTVENLAATLDLLASRFGYVDAETLDPDMPKADERIMAFNHSLKVERPYRVLPRDLAKAGELPSPETFFTPELRELLQLRFAADIALYERAGQPAGATA
jgi:predicted negative regulator of RcsB-dependent stress response